jgi:hypothetical protein
MRASVPLGLLAGEYRSAEGLEAHAIPGEGADVQVRSYELLAEEWFNA